jgi:hypothetical protein
MSADATSRTCIVKRASRWSKPATAPASPKAIVIGAQASPRPSSARHHLTATLLRLASTVDIAHLTQLFQPSPIWQSGLLSVHSHCGLHTRAVTNS